MTLHQDCCIKVMSDEVDLESKILPIEAHNIKNGMWLLDDKSGFPGVVSDVKRSKTGKHGHAKVTYKLRMPHSNRVSSLMHAGKDRLFQPSMQKIDYLVSHMDNNNEDIVLVDNESSESLYFKLCNDTRKSVYDKMIKTINTCENNNNKNNEQDEVYATVLEGPMMKTNKKGNIKISILQIIVDSKIVKSN